MSSASFVPERAEIWYSDGHRGFFNVRVTNGVWPFAEANQALQEPVPAPTSTRPAGPESRGLLPATGAGPSLLAAGSVLTLILALRTAHRRAAR